MLCSQRREWALCTLAWNERIHSRDGLEALDQAHRLRLTADHQDPRVGKNLAALKNIIRGEKENSREAQCHEEDPCR